MNKTIRKIFLCGAMFSVLALSLFLAGCGSNSNNGNGGGDTLPAFVNVASVRFNQTTMTSQIVITLPYVINQNNIHIADWEQITQQEFNNAEHILVGWQFWESVTIIDIEQDRGNFPKWGAGDYIYHHAPNSNIPFTRIRVTSVEMRYVQVRVHNDSKFDIRSHDGATLTFERQTDFVTIHRDANGNITRLQAEHYDIRFFT